MKKINLIKNISAIVGFFIPIILCYFSNIIIIKNITSILFIILIYLFVFSHTKFYYWFEKNKKLVEMGSDSIDLTNLILFSFVSGLMCSLVLFITLHWMLLQ